MAQKNTTGLRPETFKRLQLNAGILLKDFAYSSATDAAALATLIKTAKESGTALLGATRGGGTFTCTPRDRGGRQAKRFCRIDYFRRLGDQAEHHPA